VEESTEESPSTPQKLRKKPLLGKSFSNGSQPHRNETSLVKDDKCEVFGDKNELTF